MQTATDVLTLFARAIPVAQRVVDGMRPEQLTAPTPCTEWDARAVLDHLSGLLRSAAEATGETPNDPDLRGGDLASAFAVAARAADAVFRAPGALERSFAMPWGETMGETLATLLFMDLVIHSWDLAKATGQSAALDADLCEAALSLGRSMMREEYRTPEAGFGPEIAVPIGAPACDRLAGFFGRRP